MGNCPVTGIFRFVLNFANSVWTNEVDAYSFPWNQLWILGVEQSQFGMSLFVFLAEVSR
jgi:hypothetical protein